MPDSLIALLSLQLPWISLSNWRCLLVAKQTLSLMAVVCGSAAHRDLKSEGSKLPEKWSLAHIYIG